MQATNHLLICLHRIASLSERLVRQDQSKVEDTLSMNRPSTLEVHFKNFIDEARVDACERIQSFYKSEEATDVRIYYPRLACLIFEVHKTFFGNILPRQQSGHHGRNNGRNNEHLPVSFSVSVHPILLSVVVELKLSAI